MTRVHLGGKIVKFWTYRTALGMNPLITIEDGDMWKFVKMHVERYGYRMDNHIAWKSSNGFYYDFSDHRLSVCTDISEGYW